MKHVVKKVDAKVADEHGVSRFIEYGTPFASFSMGVSEIHGRYPAEGFDADTGVDAAWYVAAGSGMIAIGGGE